MRFTSKEVQHVPGRQSNIADGLSKLQAKNQNPADSINEEDRDAHVNSNIDWLTVSDIRLQQITKIQCVVKWTFAVAKDAKAGRS